jgi:hypothetical protein
LYGRYYHNYDHHYYNHNYRNRRYNPHCRSANLNTVGKPDVHFVGAVVNVKLVV